MNQKVWLKEYTSGVPDTINPDAFDSLVHLYEKYAADFSSRPVYTSFGISLSYNEVKNYSRDFAAFLQQELQLKKGDRIAIMMPNILQYPIAIFGALKAGLIVVNINPLYTAPELIQQLNDSGAQTILVLETFACQLETVLPQMQLKHILIAKIGDLLGFAKGALYNFIARSFKKKYPIIVCRTPFFLNKPYRTEKTILLIMLN